MLRFVESLSVNEIARITGSPEGTVKSRLHHAVAKLREQIGQQDSTMNHERSASAVEFSSDVSGGTTEAALIGDVSKRLS